MQFLLGETNNETKINSIGAGIIDEAWMQGEKP